MGEALEKMKAELMLVGFISLLLAVAQDPISKICISVEAGRKMLPCKPNDGGKGKDNHRRLLWLQGETHRRFLAAPAGEDVCAKQGKVALMSAGSMHQLHIFIFVLAVFHVLYSVVTMALSRLKMKQWKKWESETASLEYQFANDPSRCRFTHQTTFVRRHLGLSSTPGVRWVVAFFRQFFTSVTKVDYLTLRQGFINAHLSQKSSFDFNKYIKRSLEDNFKVVVGIRTIMQILLWVGTKLEMVIMEMAQEIQDRESVVKGAPVVEPSNKYFWFNRPDWVLFLIHLTLFQNAFQMAHFVWTVATPGLKKCYHEKMGVSIAKVVLGVAAQIMCSYITFPLYALVTQMGSHMKRSVFDEQTARALTNWRKMAKKKKKVRDAGMLMAQMGGGAAPSVGSSPVHLLHKAGARSDDPQSVPASPRAEKEGGGVQYPAAAHPVRRVPPVTGGGRPRRRPSTLTSPVQIFASVRNVDRSDKFLQKNS